MKEYTTERGITIKIVPIPMLLQRIRDQNPPPERPTYAVEMAGGDKKDFPIDEESHPDEFKTWRLRVAIHDNKVNQLIWAATMKRAILVEMPEDDSWAADHAELGLTVPDDPAEKQVHYLETEVLGGMRDVIRITAIANGSDIDEEALAAAENSFQSIISKQAIKQMAGPDRGPAK